MISQVFLDCVPWTNVRMRKMKHYFNLKSNFRLQLNWKRNLFFLPFIPKTTFSNKLLLTNNLNQSFSNFFLINEIYKNPTHVQICNDIKIKDLFLSVNHSNALSREINDQLYIYIFFTWSPFQGLFWWPLRPIFHSKLIQSNPWILMHTR